MIPVYSLQGKFLWFLASIFFLFQYYVRASIGVMAAPMMAEFGISATVFATMASLYYIGYGGIQIILGAFVDTKGPVKSILLGLFLLLVSHIAITWSGGVRVLGEGYLVMCRFLTGVGSAAALISLTKLTGYQWPAKRFAVMFSVVFTVGVVGGVFAPKIVLAMMQFFSWQKTIYLSVLAGCALWVSLFVLRSHYKGPVEKISLKKLLAVQFETWSFISRPLFFLGVIDALLGGPLYVLGDVWGVLFLQDACHLTTSQATTCTMWIYVGYAIGSFLEPYVSRYVGYTCKLLVEALIALSLLALVGWLNSSLSFLCLQTFMFFVGWTCSYQVTVLRVAASSFEKNMIGRNVSFVNACNMLGGFVFVWVFGFIMDLVDKPLKAGQHVYSLCAYQLALSSFLLCILVGAFFIIRLYCIENTRNRN